MILSDRKKDIYNDNYSCPLNCTYSSYSIETGSLACNCSINNDNITLEDISNLRKIKEVLKENFVISDSRVEAIVAQKTGKNLPLRF